MRNRRKRAIGSALSALFLVLIALAVTGGAGLAAGSSASGTTVLAGPLVHKQMQPGMRVGHSVRNDVSPALRSMPRLKYKPTGRGEAAENPSLLKGRKPLSRRDTVVQKTMPGHDMPSPILNFDGIPFPGVNCNCAPPDTDGEVGLTQYVQIVNEGFQVFNKTTGASIFGPASIESLWNGFGGLCETNGFGDPVTIYDQLANRWVITEFAGPIPITDECVAVSTTSDATGSYARYDFHLGSDFFDYPKLGVWPDAYYMSMNVFNSGGTAFLGPQAFALDRSAMLAGNPATFIAGPRGSPSDNPFMPADLDGSLPPPANAPNPFVAAGANSTWPLYRFHVDFANPANSTFTLGGTLTPAPFSVICGGGACVPQLGTADPLDTLGDRGMFRSAYRMINGHESLVGNMTVASGGVAGIRWFDLDNVTSGTPNFTQESTYQPDNTWRWMGSIAEDASGDMALGYSASNATINPQIRYAGRLVSDPPNTLGQAEVHLFDGTGSQTDTVSRWGDYSDMTVDPVDDCTFWYTQEYYQTTSSFNWRTRIGNFKFPSCTTAPTGTLEGTVTDSSNNNPISGATITVQPLGASTTTGPDGHYSFTLPVGDYQVTAHSFGYDDQTQPASVTDGGDTILNFALNPSPSGSLSGTVTDSTNNPIQNATVTILGTPISPATTDATGHYSFSSVPNGTYNVKAEAGQCTSSQTDPVTVNGPTTHDFSLAARHDAFGYSCRVETPSYIEGDTLLGLSGDDNSTAVSLPFTFTLYGQSYTTAYVCTNGHLTFQNPGPGCPFSNESIPTPDSPNAAIYPFWDDMYLDASSATYTATLSNPNRFVIEWRNASFFPCCGDRVDFEAVLYENGQILTEYRNVDNAHEQGNSATIGIENADGTDAFQYSFNQPTIGTPTFAVRYLLPPSGFAQGHVTDANDHLAISGAIVKALQGANVVRQVATDGTGFYRMQLPVGSYTLQVTKGNYETVTRPVVITEDGTTTADFSLRTPRGEVSPTSLQFIVPADQTRTKTLTLSNTGSLAMTWDIQESGAPTRRGKTLRSAGVRRALRSRGARLVRITLGKGELASPASLAAARARGRVTGSAVRAHGTVRAPLDPTWSTIANYPVGIMDNSADIIDGKEYSVGGFDTTFSLSNHGYVYDPDTNTWSSIADMPLAREKPAVAAVGGLLYVSGGWDAIGNPIARTDVYDPGTNTWSTVAPNPHPTAAPGVAVADGQIYLVGGCADSACTPSSTVVRYDPGSNSWETVASYPTTDSWEGCAGLSGTVYCAGGVNGGTTLSSGAAYDPGSNSWSPIAPMPIDLWGMVSGGPNGLLVVASGVTNGFNTVTNQAFAYDPGSNSWTALANATFARYRAGGSCGFYKVGGSSAGFSPSPESEKLSELDSCGITDVPWLSESPTSGTIQPGSSDDIHVVVDTHGLTPGVYHARVTIRTNSGRRPNISVPVQLIVPAYEQGFDSGGGAYVDGNGDTWAADRAYTPQNGSGYVQSPPKTTSTRSAIDGTTDDPLYQKARVSTMSYRFTGLPAGAYLLELRFAEIENKRPGQRQFDVIVNGLPYLIAFDISAQVGRNYALDRSLYVTVPANGEVSVQLATRRSTGVPILNAIRVTNRPDH
jgi:N-acetylneuraminic acid mutarotase